MGEMVNDKLEPVISRAFAAEGPHRPWVLRRSSCEAGDRLSRPALESVQGKDDPWGCENVLARSVVGHDLE